ncbi:MAG: hypothetical protein H0V60_01480 [Actinobacteria bacterium]|nr:hypothetical protein [Actinomycetota bacterium]
MKKGLVRVLELVLVCAMAVLWWVPAFKALTDLQAREGVRRVLVWKWTAILCVPVAGALLYQRRGRQELDRSVEPRR